MALAGWSLCRSVSAGEMFPVGPGDDGGNGSTADTEVFSKGSLLGAIHVIASSNDLHLLSGQSSAILLFAKQLDVSLLGHHVGRVNSSGSVEKMMAIATTGPITGMADQQWVGVPPMMQEKSNARSLQIAA